MSLMIEFADWDETANILVDNDINELLLMRAKLWTKSLGAFERVYFALRYEVRLHNTKEIFNEDSTTFNSRI